MSIWWTFIDDDDDDRSSSILFSEKTERISTLRFDFLDFFLLFPKKNCPNKQNQLSNRLKKNLIRIESPAAAVVVAVSNRIACLIHLCPSKTNIQISKIFD